MTDTQREQIINLRQQGKGYTTIATTIGLTKENVGKFCRNHGLGGIKSQVCTTAASNADICLNCGLELEHTPGARKKKFCNVQCRQTWWNAHQSMVVRKAFYSYTCPACGKVFTAYGNNHRKYCTHSCYIAARFKKHRIASTTVRCGCGYSRTPCISHM